jgi:hypothetical protein
VRFPSSVVRMALHDMKSSNNLIILVPTEGGLPLLNLSELRKNLKP